MNLWIISRRDDYYSRPRIANILFFGINMIVIGNKKPLRIHER